MQVITAKHRKAISDCQLVMKSNYSIAGGNCHKYHFCHNKTCLLSQQIYFCCDKTFVMTIICHDKHKFVTTKLLSQQAYFCPDKPVFWHDKSMLVATQLLLFVATNICREKSFVATKIFCHDKHNFTFVVASIRFLWQITCFVATNMCLSWQRFCRDKNDTCGSSHQCYHRDQRDSRRLAGCQYLPNPRLFQTQEGRQVERVGESTSKWTIGKKPVDIIMILDTAPNLQKP